MSQAKTNAMRMLEKAGIPFEVRTYGHEDGLIDGVSVAAKVGLAPEQVFKTLVTQGASRQFYVFVLPVQRELDLKKAAKSVGEKSVEMIHMADLQKTTGYIRGGCSPVGMKKLFPTVIDGSARSQPAIAVSGGRIGVQVLVEPEALASLVKARFASIAVE